jgi:hypothetical protein
MKRVSRSILLRLAPVAAALLIACNDGVGVLPAGRTVFVTSGESHELTVVDGGIGRVVERTQLPSFTGSASLWRAMEIAMAGSQNESPPITIQYNLLISRTLAGLKWRAPACDRDRSGCASAKGTPTPAGA